MGNEKVFPDTFWMNWNTITSTNSTLVTSIDTEMSQFEEILLDSVGRFTTVH